MVVKNDVNSVETELDRRISANPDDAGLRALRERMEELRAQGILSGGYGPRRPIQPVSPPVRPGALKRFLKHRG